MPGRKGLLAPQNTFLDTIAKRFDGTHSNFVLGNAQVTATFPIVYCSDGFCELTGFSRAQVMGKGCACPFLWGSETDASGQQAIDQALHNKEELKLEINFYTKTGKPFLCLLDIVPIKNEKRQVVLFLASHKNISDTNNNPRRGAVAKISSPSSDPSHPKSFFSGLNQLPLPGHTESERVEGEEVRDVDESVLCPSSNGLLDPEAPANYNYSRRRRSRAVLYQLSGHYQTDKTKKIQAKISTNSLLSPPSTNIQPLPEYKSSTVERPRFVLSHYGVLKTLWDMLVLVATIYVGVRVPYNAAFHPHEHDHDLCNGLHNNSLSVNKVISNESTVLAVADIVVETIFIVDIGLNFRTTFVNRKGEVVTESGRIAFHYVRGWFLLDLIAAFPFDLINALSKMDSESFTSIHLLKLTRLLRLVRLLQKMDRYSQYSLVILTLLMATFVLLAHWMACVWYVIGWKEQPDYSAGEHSSYPGWLNLLAHRLGLPHGACLPQSEAYVTALYYTCTSLTTVGFGNVSANTTPEKIFSVVIMLMGALMHATIFGNVTALVQRMYGARKSLYLTKWRDLKDFSILHSVPKALQTRMQDYFQTMWSLNHGIDPVEILSDYPQELRGDVSLHLHKEILSLPIFETASEGCRKLISLGIKTNFCAPDEYLVHKGDALQSIYYLFNGSMEVLKDDMVVAILGKGDLVGCDISRHLAASKESASAAQMPEVVIKSSCDVKAITYCDLKCVHIPGLVDVLRLYPEFRDQFANDILHDLTFNLREGWEQEEEAERAGSPHSGHSVVSDTSSHSSDRDQGANNETCISLKQVQTQLATALEQLEKLTSTSSTSTTTTVDRAMQTEASLDVLEHLVLHNRPRILRLLATRPTMSLEGSTSALHECCSSIPSFHSTTATQEPGMTTHGSLTNVRSTKPPPPRPSRAVVSTGSSSSLTSTRGRRGHNATRQRRLRTTPLISIDMCSDEDNDGNKETSSLDLPFDNGDKKSNNVMVVNLRNKTSTASAPDV